MAPPKKKQGANERFDRFDEKNRGRPLFNRGTENSTRADPNERFDRFDEKNRGRPEFNRGPASSSLSPAEEAQFQRDMRTGEGYRQWFEQYVREYGEEPDLNAKDYDYRAAWKAGVRPSPYEHDNGAYHWSSSANGQMLKSESHPTAWMERFMQATGKDPNEVGVKSPEEAKAYMAGPRVSIGDAEVLDPWSLDIGMAEIQDPWQVDFGQAEMGPWEDAAVPMDPYGYEAQFGLADLPDDGTTYLPRESVTDPLQSVTVGPGEIVDPWSVR